MLRKQSWYSEYLESQRLAEPVPFVGRYSVDDGPEIIARDIAEVIGVNDEMRREAINWEKFLTTFVRKAETAGVLVFRSGVVAGNNHRSLSVEEFRGFAITDEFAPLVFINAKDAKVAQIFTLAHELAHLWIGESGVSNQNYAVRSDEQVNHVDRLCDKVAAEVLVPEADFLARWDPTRDPMENIRALGVQYRVSRFVVLRRAYETNTITSAVFRRRYEEFRNDYHRPAGGGGDFYNLFLARNSSTVAHALLTATAEGRIARLDAARLLNVRVDTIAKAHNELFGAGSSSA